MTWPHIRILIVLAVGLQSIKGADTNGETEQTNSDSPVPPERSLPEQKPLLLTPLIMNCSYDEAREKAKWNYLKNGHQCAFWVHHCQRDNKPIFRVGCGRKKLFL
uniref:Putative secreted protein n=1 Tax=Rhipicephalus microplus TaxID=6941 RepID=A0A6G5A0G0_RHIMP